MPSSQLLILGNGFDLHCGLKSSYKDFFQNEVARFEEEYPGYHIDVLRIPDNQWIEVAKTKAVTGELTDIIRIDKGLMEDIGVGKFVEMDETESWYGRVREEQLENKKIGGKLYGLPVGASSSVGLIYNRQIFEDLGLAVPKTMEEFRNICKAWLVCSVWFALRESTEQGCICQIL